MTLGSDSLSQRELSENAFSFSYKGFLSQTLTTHRAGGEGRGPSFIPLYHLHPLMNIQTFICNFACEMLSRIFNCTACIYQTATR